jgi:hypothetical protein
MVERCGGRGAAAVLLLDLVQRGVARIEDVERQLTQESLESFIASE